MDQRLLELDQALRSHAVTKDFSHAQRVVEAVLGLFQQKPSQHDWDKPKVDNDGKIRANAGWFMNAPGYADRRAIYRLADKNDRNIDFSVFWLKKYTKSVISWLVALTNNYEDKPYNKIFNIGIDFVIPESADKVLVVLSSNFTLRTLELSGSLSKTDLEIFNKWIQPLDFANKEQVHAVLWDSFDFEPVNRIFYKKISELFVDLKQHLVNNELFDDRHASYFANRLIGRVIFCWFLDKKGIINPKMGYFNTNNQDSTTYYHSKLEPLFFETLNQPISMRTKLGSDLETPFLNGGLFESRVNDLKGDPKLTFPADYFDRLYEHLHHYHFTTDESTSDYQQVAIDPEMLGRIFENLLAEQSEDTGAQARKAKGAFYTPREIVDYMCKESLRQYLRSQMSDSTDIDQRIAELLDIKTHEFRDQQRNYRANLAPYKYDLLKALDNLKVLDPACGSGAFPMGMQQLLLTVYERLDNTFDPYKKKIEVLKNNIYGVDIEPMAVEISRLRAWLSIIVDQDPKVRVEALPNLDFKFVCANSLLPLDPNITPGLGFSDKFESKLAAIRDQFFATKEHDKKDELKKEFEKIIKEDVIDGFAENTRIKQLKTYIPFNSENVTAFFDPDFMFGFSLFNIILGNPPYIKEYVNKAAFDLIRKSKYYQGKMDLWYMFACIGLDYLETSGIECFIAQNNWTTSSGASNMRNKIVSDSKILKLIDFGNYKIFKSAGIQTMVMIFQKRTYPEKYKFDYRRVIGSDPKSSEIIDILNKNTNTCLEYLESEITRSKLVDKTFTFSSNSYETILLKLESNANYHLNGETEVAQGIVPNPDIVGKSNIKLIPLDKIKKFNIKINDGVFVISKNQLKNTSDYEKNLIKPLFEPTDLAKYYINDNYKKNILYLTKECVENKIPIFIAHLKKYREIMDQRRENKNGHLKFYHLHWSRNSKYFEAGPKILSVRKCSEPTFVYTNRESFVMMSINVIKTERMDNRYLTGLLNSNLIKFWLKYRGKMQGNNYQIDKEPLVNIPIKIANDNIQGKIIDIVNELIMITSESGYNPKNPPQKQKDLESQIDQLVYKLYDLKPEEIKVVENDK